MKAKIILLVFFILSTAAAQAQLSDFGEARAEELQLSQREAGTDHDALILFEAGEMYFTESLDLALTYHIRIKLFNENAFEYGTHNITFSPGVRQKVEDLSASVHRFNSRGRMVAEFVPDSIFQTSDIGNGIKEISFQIPDLKPGSVIEYTYTKIFGHPANIPEWIIQRDIPVRFNTLIFWDDNYFDFNVIAKGTKAIDQQQQEVYSDYLGVGTRYTWDSEFVPALKDPGYLHNIENYRSRIDFKLTGIDIANQITEDLTQTWDDIHDDLEADYYFAGQLVPNQEIDRVTDKIRNEPESKLNAIQSVYDLVADSTVWNGEYDIRADNFVRKTVRGVPSSSASINLLLTRMLRNNSVQADPVLISTRENGYMYVDEIDTGQFNHLIVRATIGDEVYYLDASQGKRPVQLTPLNDLNKAGIRYGKDTLQWVDVDAYDISDIQVSVTGVLNDDGTIAGQLSGKVSGYYTQDDPVNDEKIREWFKGSASSTASITLNEPLISEYSQADYPVITFRSDSIMIQPDGTEKDDYTLKFSPLIAFTGIENPFTDSLRAYPVELDFPFSRVFNADIRLPEGYRITELPEPVTARLPDGKGRLLIVTQEVGDRISYLMQFEISDDYFSVAEYPALREIYRLAEMARNSSIDLIRTN